MNKEELKPGILLKSNRLWTSPIKLEAFEHKGKFIKIKGYCTSTKEYIDRLISLDDLNYISAISEKSLFTADSEKFFLGIETLRYRYASLYDPLLAVNISKVEPLPHQIEAVYGYVLKQPRIRFLIADDPGAGKTIMAGLIIKELKLRCIINRILIICPGHLKTQWQIELKEKFDENFTIIDRNIFNENYYSNIWEKENQFITSIDFAKQDEILTSLENTNFDLVIVDEAHKMSAYQYGDKTSKSKRYKLGETISKISMHRLFLTATPHKGDPENFRLFLDLLEPGFFANQTLIKESIANKDNPLFIRRIKEDLKNFDGSPLFLPRHVNTVSFKLSDEERELYNALSKYVENEYKKVSKNDNKNKNIAFALTILQRRFASSVYANLKSLKRRKQKLEELLKESERVEKKSIEQKNNFIIDIDEIDDLEENEREKFEQNWETTTFSKDNNELREEISKLEELINKAKNIIAKESEIKLSKLKESLEELSSNVSEIQRRKIIIFTESRDTLEYLEEKIKNWGYKVTVIHGGMNMEQRREAEIEFRNESEILIATEAAGEGVNLQFCNLMINYDIPWNPNRLEQRMGRIHRYGQTREVFIHNLVNVDTREGQVLNKLFNKINEIRDALGNDKVFDVLGELIESKKFKDALYNAAVNAKSLDEILKEIDFEVDQDYINRVKENLGETLATHFIDYTAIKEMSIKAKESRLIPEYTQNYFIKAFEKAGGKVEKKADNTYQIKSIPAEIRNIANNDKFKRLYGLISKNYPSITFDKEIARKNSSIEFVSLGHPLFEAIMQWVEEFQNEVLQTGTVFYDPDGKLDGYILFYEGTIKDGTGNIAGKKIFSFFASSSDTNSDFENIHLINPSVLWDLKEGNSSNIKLENLENLEIEQLKSKIEDKAIECLEEYKNEILKERIRQAEIKQKYGLTSLKCLIEQLDKDLIDLIDRKENGENVDISIYNKKTQKESYEKAKNILQETIEREKSLSMDTPSFIGIVKVEPLFNTLSETMSEDAQIEAIGMNIAMEYEKKEGRIPEDVSSQNLGYDIRSTDSYGNVRYIEVKARAYQGDIALTQNEWFIAQRFNKDYYLYVIFNAATKPELFILQNPANIFTPEKKIEVVRYFIKKEDILKK